jgi:hypothetical protein
MARHQKRI